jgi:kynureninase
VKCIDEHADSTALVLLPGVQYYTGQVFPLATIAKVAHKHGIVFGVDLAHAVGNVKLELHDWEVDFAAWCSYKYLNSGPGGIAGVFLHDRHSDHADPRFPRLDGWFGQAVENRFKMGQRHIPLKGAGAFVMSNPAVLPVVSLLGSLEIFHEAGMDKLVEKSRKLTQYLEDLLVETGLYPDRVKILTPKEGRGCQLSVQVKNVNVRDVHKAITAKGVICDVREPNVLRIAPVPLYNSFSDVFRFVKILQSEISQ